MHLSTLIKNTDMLQDWEKEQLDRITITGITSDSREVKSGYIFAALNGVNSNGVDFIPDAIKKGAVVILAPMGTSLPDNLKNDQKIILIETTKPRQKFAQLAAAYHNGQPDYIVAVTGSNGKTSTAHFARQIWQDLGFTAASLGTIGIQAPGIEKLGSLTTPDPVTLHSEIAELAASDVTHLAMEASSHGLDQHRLDGLTIRAAGFTNLTRDHLDYHETMDGYLAAKARLFTDVLCKDGTAVLNADIPEFSFLEKICENRGHKLIRYGFKGTEIRILNRAILPDGQMVELQVFGETYAINLPLVGEFQLYNTLCALGLVLAEFPKNARKQIQAMHLLEGLEGVRGRLEFVGSHPNGAAIYVDYAHTPDALENVLKALRPHTKGKLHVIIGCGGDRDRGKRPMMGSIAKELADHVIVTDDNPRTEDPAQIRAEIITACPNAEEFNDRRRAICSAVQTLKPYDLLVVTGKGHEQGQIIGQDVIPFDDATEIRTALAEI